MTDHDLRRILRALSPGTLRAEILLPFGEWREEFQLRFLATRSFDALIGELGRFIAHVRRHWHGVDLAWPRDRAEDEARRLLDATIGVRATMQTCRHGDRGGLRMILDTVTKELQAEALAHYVDMCVLPKIERLPFRESEALAAAYLAAFDIVPGLERERPALLVDRWQQVLHEHARLILDLPRPRRQMDDRRGRQPHRPRPRRPSRGSSMAPPRFR